MPSYTNFLGLYKPSRNDSLALDTTLADNFSKIDNQIGSALTDSDGETYATLNERLETLKKSKSKNFVIATDNKNIKADGTYDDTAGIQELLDLAIVDSGVRIVFPAGQYTIKGDLRMRQGTFIDAQLGAVFTKKHNGAFMLNLETSDNMTGYDGNGDITINGGVWDANFPAYTGGTSFIIGHASNVLFSNMTMLNHSGGHAVEFNASQNVFVTGCKFFGFDDEGGTRTYSEAIQLDLDKPGGAFPWGGNAEDHTPCRNIWIDKNEFGPSETLGGWGRAVGTHSATAGKYHEFIFITNNVVHDCNHWAFRAYSWRDVQITGNLIFNCGGGISIDPNAIDGTDNLDVNGNAQSTANTVERVLIANNLIKGGGDYGSGMSITGESSKHLYNISIQNNLFEDCNSAYMLYIAQADEVTVNGNTFKGGKVGLKCSETFMIEVNGNLFRTLSDNGIEIFTGNDRFNIVGNSFYFITGNGIHISGVDTITISSNTFVAMGYNSGSAKQGIRVTTSADRGTILGNTFRLWGGSANMDYAIYVSSSCPNYLVGLNNSAGISNNLHAGVTEYGNLT